MRIHLYLDEDSMSTDLVRALRSRDIQVVTATDAKMAGSADEDHLKYAASRALALYSFNIKDYMRLHTRFLEQGISHQGIVLAQQSRYSVGEQLRRLLQLVDSKSAEEMKDNIVFL